MVQNPGKGSPIHDHANAHCVMKILKGSLRETLYDYPDSGDTSRITPAYPSLSPIKAAAEAAAPTQTKQTTYTQDQVTYISDKIGLHKIENPSQTEIAISLHLYTPPHAANFGFNIFDSRTGKKSHVTSPPVFSRYGEIPAARL